MDIIPEGHDERSLSGASFASLELIHSQEEDDDIARGEDATPRRSNNLEYAYHLDRTGHVNEQQQTDTDYSCDDDDGYPTDEGGSFTQPKEKKLRRLHILELARSRLAMKKTNDTPEGSDMTADSSFLANADAVDVENRPDDSTFLADADVEDVTVAKPSRQYNADDIEADSYYDVHASALSRASASKASTIGDQIYKESMLAARMANKEAKNTLADAQSASTYSYRRAYGDNVTLGSTLNSTCSALTDDYCFDARKTGMSDAIVPRKVPEERPCDDNNDIRRSYSGPADVDTGTMMHPSGDNTVEESLARPPPHSLPYMSSDMMECDGEYPEHTARIVTFGDERFVSFGDGYVDEGAMQKDRNSGCCGWFVSSSRVIKFVVICASLLLLVSIASLTIAYLLPTDEGTSDKESSAVSSEFSIFDTSGNSDVEGNVEGNDDDGDGDGDDDDDDALGQSGWVAYSPSEDESLDSTPTNFPTALATRARTKAPSQAPESFVFTTSSITKSPSNQPSKRPTSKPASLPPSKQPTVKPTYFPTRKPTNVPTPSASKRPTNQPTTLIPTEMPIINMAPTVPSPSLSSSVTPLLTKTVTLQASKDTYVTRTSPDQNWGYYGRLRVDDSPRAWSFIRFDMTSAFNSDQNEPRKLQSMQVVEAKLRLYTLDEGGGGMIYALPNARRWRESKLTWNNMDQALDRTGQFEVGSIDWVKAFQWYEIDVTDAFQGGIVQTFLIKASTTNGVAFSSRDNSGNLGPQLALKFTTSSGTSLGKSMPISEPPTREPATISPSKQPSSPAAPKFVPPGCPSTADFDFAFKGAFVSKQDMPANLQVVYPSQDSCVSGGPSTSIKLLEFDLGAIAQSSSISLRLYANIVDDINTISLHSLPDFEKWNEEEVARDDFGIPPISKAGPSFQVTPSDTGRWMDIDITDMIDGSDSADEKFVLVMDSVSAGDSGGGCIFASRDTCHSPKLVAMTELT